MSYVSRGNLRLPVSNPLSRELKLSDYFTNLCRTDSRLEIFGTSLSKPHDSHKNIAVVAGICATDAAKDEAVATHK